MTHNMKAVKIIHDDFQYGAEEHEFFEREGGMQKSMRRAGAVSAQSSVIR